MLTALESSMTRRRLLASQIETEGRASEVYGSGEAGFAESASLKHSPCSTICSNTTSALDGIVPKISTTAGSKCRGRKLRRQS
jgi:hypothetical protein